MRVAFVGGVVGAFALVICAQAIAAGHGNAVQTDPRASSPAGVIYRIPLDNGRRDAAPVLPVGNHPGGPGPGVSGSSSPSSIHSENGFGSSSRVPGTGPAALRNAAGIPAIHTPGSAFPTFLLVVLIAAGAIGAGVLATGAKRLRSEGAEYRTPDL
jgi:hypothetical protein